MLSRKVPNQSLYMTWMRICRSQSSAQIIKASINKKIDDTKTVEQDPRPFYEIPGPKGWPFIGTLLDYKSQGGFGKIFLVNQKFYKQYGSIFKETVLGKTSVNICDPWEIEKVFRAETKYPSRAVDFEFWTKCCKERGVPLNMVFIDGEEWYQARKSLAPKLMRPKELHVYLDRFDEVADDAIISLRKARGEGNPEGEVTTMVEELKNWALESIGTMIFDTRIGIYDSPSRKGAQDLIQAIDDMFESMMGLVFGTDAVLWRFISTKNWKKFCNAFDVMYRVGGEYVQKRMEELKMLGENPDKIEESEVHSLLTHLLLDENKTTDDAIATSINMMSAGVDTTSNTLMWLLYHLALNQKAQEHAHSEVYSLIGKDGRLTKEDLRKIPYLRGCLKETMRLIPPSPFNTRVLEVDVELNGYHVPAGTTIQMSTWHTHYSEEYYDNPNEFRPERWFRGNGEDIHPFAHIPFGFGTRMCLGRRVAEMEIFVLLSKILQNFHIKYIRDEKVQPVAKLSIFPEKPIHLHFTDRIQ